MYLGRIVEMGTSSEIFDNPTHPYTQALLSAVLTMGDAARPDPIVLRGDMPDPAHIPSGCRFRTRCWKAQERCAREVPELTASEASDHPSACLFAQSVLARAQ
jgi:oligopeptide/dipeptide ABC transporter ATP-binding protein